MRALLVLPIIFALMCLSLPACNMPADAQSREERHRIVATSPEAKDVVITQQYVCQIHSQRHIEIRALQEGYLELITLKEGQAVKEGDVMFRVIPILYKARLDAEKAKARLAEITWKNAVQLAKDKVVSDQEVALRRAELDEANAKVQLAQAEYNFTEVKASFDGIVNLLLKQQGSLVKKEEILTTLSDNSLMWVYFNVPEARYLEDMAGVGQDNDTRQIDLVLANGSKFPQHCKSVVKTAQFNNETGNIQYRADFPNPDGLLRHGQTGNILIHHLLKNAIVIPQRATFEILDKRYVWVVEKDGVIHQSEVVFQYEMDDIFVIKKKEEHKKEEHKTEVSKNQEHKTEVHITGLDVTDRIVLEGVRQVRDGEKVECELRPPGEVLASAKKHAE